MRGRERYATRRRESRRPAMKAQPKSEFSEGCVASVPPPIAIAPTPDETAVTMRHLARQRRGQCVKAILTGSTMAMLGTLTLGWWVRHDAELQVHAARPVPPLVTTQLTGAVDDAAVRTLSVGQKLAFSVDAYPGRRFRGRVTEVRSAPAP